MKISVIHATYRFAEAVKVRNTWMALAASLESIEWIYGVDRDQAAEARLALSGGLVVAATENGCIPATNAAALAATGDVLVAMSDDIVPPPGWDREITKRMLSVSDRTAMLFVSDGLRPDDLQTTQIINRTAFDALGNLFFEPAYALCAGLYADNDLTTRARSQRWDVQARELIFKHNHGSLPDERWKAHNATENYRKGAIIYGDRWCHCARGWGRVAVGCRIGHAPDPAFFCSWTDLVTKGLRPGDVVLGPSVGLAHASAGNFLIGQFLQTPCDSILMLDDDMDFPFDALERLRSADTDCHILAGVTVCRRAPFNPVALHIDAAGKITVQEIKPGVHEVDLVGLAFTLVHRSIIRQQMDGFNSNVLTWHNQLGEDGVLCKRAKEQGHKVGVCGDVNIGHRVSFTLAWNAENKKPVKMFKTFGIVAG